MALVSRNYMITTLPRQSDWRTTPFILTARQEAQNMCVVRAYTNEPKMPDGFLRFVNENIFDPAPHVFGDCHLVMTEQLVTNTVRSMYLNSYVIRR